VGAQVIGQLRQNSGALGHQATAVAIIVLLQLRELTPFGAGPKFLLRDHDGKFTATFNAVALGASIRVIRNLSVPKIPIQPGSSRFHGAMP